MPAKRKPKTVTITNTVQLQDPRVERLAKFWSGVGIIAGIAIVGAFAFVGLATTLYWLFNINDRFLAGMAAFVVVASTGFVAVGIAAWWEETKS